MTTAAPGEGLATAASLPLSPSDEASAAPELVPASLGAFTKFKKIQEPLLIAAAAVAGLLPEGMVPS